MNHSNTRGKDNICRLLSKEASFARSFLIHVAQKKSIMQAGKNDPEIQLAAWPCSFQPQAGREESSIAPGPGLGSLPRHSPRPSLVLPGAPGGSGSWPGVPCLPSQPCCSCLLAQHRTFLQHLLFVGRQENQYWHIPSVPVSRLKLSANSPAVLAPQVQVTLTDIFKQSMLERVYLSCSGFSCQQAEISSLDKCLEVTHNKTIH